METLALRTLEFLLTGGARATLLLLFAFASSVVLRRAAASTRHAVWRATFVCLLLLPLLMLALPSLRVPVLAAGTAPTAAPADSFDPISASRRPGAAPGAIRGLDPVGVVERAPGPHPPAPINWAEGVVILWILGVAVTSRRFLSGYVRIGRLTAAAAPADRARWPGHERLDVRETDAVELPMTVGIGRPTILVPASAVAWQPSWRRAVLDHEAAHARLRDPLFQAISEIVKAIFWLHPLVWLAARALRGERERAADDFVLAAETKPSDYATVLVALALRVYKIPATGGAVPILTPGGVKARVISLLDGGRSHAIGGPLPRVAIGITTLLVCLPIAAALPTVRSPKRLPGETVVGLVVDGDTRRPVVGAEVDVYDGGLLAHRTTDAEGRFEFTYLSRPNGDIGPVVYARAGNRADRKTALRRPFGLALRLLPENPVRLELRSAHRISGKVRSLQDKRPVEGARVRFVNDQGFPAGPGEDLTAQSGADGSYSFEGILDGPFTLLVEAPGFAPGLRGVKVSESSDLTNADIQLPSQAPVAAQVVDEAGRPIAGARIRRDPRYHTSDLALRYWNWDETADDGTYRLVIREMEHEVAPPLAMPGLATENVAFESRFEKIRQARLANGELSGPIGADEALAVPVTVVLKRGAFVSGTVRQPGGAPYVGRCLISYSVQTENILARNRIDVMSDDRGRYTLGPLPPGKFRAAAVAPVDAAHPEQAGPGPDRTLELVSGTRVSDVDLTVRSEAGKAAAASQSTTDGGVYLYSLGRHIRTRLLQAGQDPKSSHAKAMAWLEEQLQIIDEELARRSGSNGTR